MARKKPKGWKPYDAAAGSLAQAKKMQGKGAHLDGVKKVQKAFASLRKKAPHRFGIGLKRAGQRVLALSLLITPIEFGNLRKSGFVRHTGSGADTIVFVGFTQSYAIYVHENLEAYHKPPTSAKFLSRILREHYHDILKIVAQEMET